MSDTTKPKSDAGASTPATDSTKPEPKWENVSKRGNRRNDNKRRGNNRRNGPSTHKPAKIKFIGRTTEVEDYIFTTGANSGAIFSKSKKEILHYIGKRASEVARAISSGREHVFSPPGMPQIPNPAYDKDKSLPKHIDKPDADFNMVDRLMLHAEVKDYQILKAAYVKDRKWAYDTIIGNCDDDMVTKLHTYDEYASIDKDLNPIKLLTLIQRICFNYQNEQMPVVSMYDATLKLYSMRQKPDENMTDFHHRFNDNMEIVTACGGTLVNDSVRNFISEKEHKKKYDQLLRTQKDKLDPIITAFAEATLFLMVAGGVAAQVRRDLNNDFVKGHDNYPRDVTSARAYISNYKSTNDKKHYQQQPPETDSSLFVQNGDGKSSERDLSHITCRHPKCGQVGHYMNSMQCPERQKEIAKAAEYDKLKAKQEADKKQTPQKATPSKSATPGESAEQMLMYGLANGNYDDISELVLCNRGSIVDAAVRNSDSDNDVWSHKSINNATYSANVLGQQTNSRINANWCLLDNQSTVDIFCNPTYLSNIRTAPGNKQMHIHCNAGILVVTQIGDLPGYGTVWYHHDAIANILSQSRVEDRNDTLVTYNSRSGDGIIVHDENDEPMHYYHRCRKGLFYRDMSTQEYGHTHTTLAVATVKDNESKFTNRDVSRAKQARRFQDNMGLSLQALLDEIDSGTIRNNPITRRSARIAESIYGPSVVNLIGKTTHRKTEVPITEIEQVPRSILEHYKQVFLEADVFFINGLRFLHTISTDIKYRTSQYIADAKASTLLECLSAVCTLYRARGLDIAQVTADGQFLPLKNAALEAKIPLNICGEDEHAKTVERSIRTTKERIRCKYHQLPFRRIPARILIGIVIAVTASLNMVVAYNGVSSRYSPRYIITGKHIDFTKHCQVQTGEYAHVHESHDNSMGARTVGAIALHSTLNDEGSVSYFSLQTGRTITRTRKTPLPMPTHVIERIEKMSRRKLPGLTFGDRNDNPLPEDDMPDDSDDDPDYTTDDDDSDSGSEATPPNTPNAQNIDENSITDDDPSASVDTAEDDLSIVSGAPTIGTAGASTEAAGTPVETLQDGHTRRSGLRVPKQINYRSLSSTATHLKSVGYNNLVHGLALKPNTKINQYVQAMDAVYRYNTWKDFETVEAIALMQYNLRKGLQVFGLKGAAGVTKELKQLHDRKVLAPKHFGELTTEQRSRSLAYLMFLKQKRDGSIKGRGCADGRKQREWMNKEDTTSPTVATESLILSCMIDAHEGRDVGTADIPGAFLQTDYTKGDTHVRIEGPMLELLVKLDPSHYRKYVHTYPNGKKVLMAEIRKAMYGTLNASLLFWQKLSGTLRDDMGFVVNPYDWCTMNKLINGKQCTILWHVDDIKVSHVDPQVVTDVLKEINDWYGEIAPLTETRGPVHEYLGMTINYGSKGRVEFTMYDYIEDFLEDLPSEMRGSAPSPASSMLFEINVDNPVLLQKPEQETFHRRVAQLLYLSKRARPDIQLPVAFLCTRVQFPDTDDQLKLTRVAKYLDATIGLPLILSMDGTGDMRWHVDASFAVHNDMKSHTGATMTMGRGSAFNLSSKQKINTGSSTEAELVGVNDALSQMVWSRHFLEAQGYCLEDNICYQDNESAMKLENNGKRSSTKRTRHLHIRYFLITDRVKNKEIDISYCPTGDMVGDYHTKPLQGKQFRRFRNVILGIDADDDSLVSEYNKTAKAILKKKKESLQPTAQ